MHAGGKAPCVTQRNSRERVHRATSFRMSGSSSLVETDQDKMRSGKENAQHDEVQIRV